MPLNRIYGYGTRYEEVHKFAVNELDRTYIEINQASEDILYDENKQTYTLWLRKPDEKLAILLISKYLCNQYEKIFRDYNKILKSYSKTLNNIENLIKNAN